MGVVGDGAVFRAGQQALAAMQGWAMVEHAELTVGGFGNAVDAEEAAAAEESRFGHKGEQRTGKDGADRQGEAERALPARIAQQGEDGDGKGARHHGVEIEPVRRHLTQGKQRREGGDGEDRIAGRDGASGHGQERAGRRDGNRILPDPAENQRREKGGEHAAEHAADRHEQVELGQRRGRRPSLGKLPVAHQRR